MTWWSVLVECAAPDGAVELSVDDERYEALVEQAEDYDGAVTCGADRFSVQISVEASDALYATMEARDFMHKAITNANLPKWPVVRFEAVTESDQDAELSRPQIPELLGAAEVAQRIGVSRQRVAKLREKPDFPHPWVELAAGPVWLTQAIDRWIEDRAGVGPS